MSDRCLFTPGPLNLSSAVKDAMRVDLGSRDPTFKQVTQQLRDRLLLIAGGQLSHSAIPIQGSGTYAMEAALSTFIGKGDKALVCINGIYGERIAQILSKSGIDFEALRFPASLPIDVAEFERATILGERFTHVCFVHCETTTGLVNPMHSLLKIGRRHGLVTVVDAMSSFGALTVDVEADGIDILVSSGNKCIEAPAGVAFALVSNRLLGAGVSHARSFCLDILDQWQHFEQHQEWRTTPPTHVVQAFDKALEGLLEEGIPSRNKRYCKIRDRILGGMKALGFGTVVPQEFQSPVCLAFHSADLVPDKAAFESFYKCLAEHGICIYAKLHEQTSTFRIGCIGQIPDFWIDKLLGVTAGHFRISTSFSVQAA
ncbi:2-aminoethylphosphonate--pyruvate transaminase [Mesorhizobium sp. M1005]|uniref:2-aminoethylphosphonate--pyruvate transaminase n=1 Tax=unclassified Mesorhizobium TaxID=325217 RepID=UPI00333DBE79